MNNNNQITFQEALSLMLKSTNASELSLKIGRQPTFLSNIASNLKRGGAMTKRSLQDVYTAFPALETMVKAGAVSKPPGITGRGNHSPEHMQRMRELSKVARAPKAPSKKQEGTFNEVLIQFSELRKSLRVAFPEKAHLFGE